VPVDPVRTIGQQFQLADLNVVRLPTFAEQPLKDDIFDPVQKALVEGKR
jgi:hypothetical protein